MEVAAQPPPSKDRLAGAAFVRPPPIETRRRYSELRSSSSASAFNSRIRSRARRASTLRHPSGGERYAALAGASRARAIVFRATRHAFAMSSAVTRSVKRSVAVLKFIANGGVAVLLTLRMAGSTIVSSRVEKKRLAALTRRRLGQPPTDAPEGSPAFHTSPAWRPGSRDNGGQNDQEAGQRRQLHHRTGAAHVHDRAPASPLGSS